METFPKTYPHGYMVQYVYVNGEAAQVMLHKECWNLNVQCMGSTEEASKEL